MASYERGAVVLVPFPFTDLSGSKRRPALVVSPEGSHEEDLILCAITSQVPQRLSEQEILLEAGDMVQEQLPKKSIIKPGKFFTMHRSLIAARYGMAKQYKLLEVLRTLRETFADPGD
ncbi:type II toxin-antitoxin system PemK/MazF family toxin [soil metagenome]